MRRSKQVFICGGIVVWFTALVIIFNKQSSLENTNEDHITVEKALHEITKLQKENEHLLEIANSVKKLQFGNFSLQTNDVKNLKLQLELCKSNSNCKNQQCEDVTREHEVLVRRSKNNAIELQYAFNRFLDDLKKNPTNLNQNIDLFKTRYTTQLRAAFLDVEDLQLLNDKWRYNEALQLKKIIQNRIDYLQNPKDCDNAKKLVCNLNKACGFGCQLHHLSYCFMVAYGTQRTLIIESQNWRYNRDGWEAVFLPVSKTCTKNNDRAESWKGEEASKNNKAVLLPIVDGLSHRPPYLPLGFPEDISHRLLRLHGNPSVWWVGQFVSYLLRPQPWLDEVIEATVKESGFEHPCVGVHVRRTDKVGSEAAFHSIEEYMKHVEAWYDRLDLRLSKDRSAEKATRRVYLASDDPSVLPEARKKYPNYVFYGDTKIAQSAGLGSRYSKDSLRGVMVDIYMLSKCDYLSCTFSSQVCRVAYELMQNLHPDASDLFHSLDDIYYYGGQTGHEQKAVFPHEGRMDEISFDVGDTIGIAGNHWDGYSKGTNKRTRRVGLYPSYKVEEIFKLVKYPTYNEAPKQS